MPIFVGALLAVIVGVALNPEIHFLGAPLLIGVLAAPLSVLWIVGVTNAFNLVDGLDGLSAGLALISAVSLAARVFIVAGEQSRLRACFVLAGALLGFLPFNAYPAKIFLGRHRRGSVGFILACFALKGGSTLSAGFATVLPILVLGLPVAETLISMARRLAGARSGAAAASSRRTATTSTIAAEPRVGHRRPSLSCTASGFSAPCSASCRCS